MGLKRTSAPAQLAVTVAEARQQIALFDNSLDDLVERYVKASIEAVERYTGRSLITQTWRLSLNEFPCASDYRPRAEIRLPRPPLQSITSIVYVDTDGDDTTLSSSLYNATSDIEPARVEPAYNEVWPQARYERESVRVTYVAGYGTDSTSVPEAIRHAVLLMVSHWFTNREPVNIGNITTELPMSAKWLLDAYRTGAGAEWYELAE